MDEQFGYAGQARPGAGTSQFSAMTLLVRQMLGRLSTCTLVRVVAVTNNGGVEPVGFVDVQPLVNQMDGAGNAVPHSILYQLPYFRVQGGTDAVILDPKVGDIGIAAFSSRDISTVKATKQQGNPGSWRLMDMADGLYFGGVLNGTPVQYVQFEEGAIRVVSPSRVIVEAPHVDVNAATQCAINAPSIVLNGTVTQGQGSHGGTSTWQGDMDIIGTVRNNGVNIGSTHTHSGVQSGGSNTGVPNT